MKRIDVLWKDEDTGWETYYCEMVWKTDNQDYMALVSTNPPRTVILDLRETLQVVVEEG